VHIKAEEVDTATMAIEGMSGGMGREGAVTDRHMDRKEDIRDPLPGYHHHPPPQNNHRNYFSSFSSSSSKDNKYYYYYYYNYFY